jgi:hypothetical protein
MLRNEESNIATRNRPGPSKAVANPCNIRANLSSMATDPFRADVTILERGTFVQ